MSTTNLLAFMFTPGKEKDRFHRSFERLAEELEKKGIEHKGPRTYKSISRIEAKNYLGDVNFETVKEYKRSALPPSESWFTSIELSDQEKEALLEALDEAGNDPTTGVIMGRGLKIFNDFNLKDHIEDFPKGVFLRISIDKPVIPENKHSPYTYDPNNDHITDMNFEVTR